MQLPRSLFTTLRLISAVLLLKAVKSSPNSGRRPTIACRKRASGVTLIELMVTISIAVITITIAVPSFQGVITRNRIASFTNQLVQSFHLARSEAIKRGRNVIVCPSNSTNDADPTCDGTAWTDGWIIYLDQDGDSSFNNDDVLIRVGQLGAVPVQITTSEFADGIEFRPTGQAHKLAEMTTGSGSFILCLPPEQRTIEVTPTGRIRLDKGSCE